MNLRRILASMRIAVLLALFTHPALAQSSPTETFGEVVRVDLVNVEVWVTDADGHPVVGLTPDDFDVREDGESVEIVHFEEIRSGALEALVRSSDLEASGGEGAEVDRPAGKGVAPVEPSLVVFFDELRLAPTFTKRAIRDLRVFLATGTIPAHRVMIVRQNEDLILEAGFGSKVGQLDDALDRIEGTSTRGTAMEKELVFQELKSVWEQSQNVTGDPCVQFMRRAGMYIDQWAGEAANRQQTSLRHLSDLAGFLAGLDGVKTLLYVGDSLETTPGKDFVAWVEDLCPLTQRGGQGFKIPQNLGETFFSLTRHANANRVTIYALQATGLRAGGLGDASVAGGASRGNASLSRIETEFRLNEIKGMDLLADGTGGRVLANSNKYTKALQGMGQEMGNYYSLAYRPPHQIDGTEHRIKVKVDGARFEVRHRSGYRAKGDDEKMAERIEGAIYLGLTKNPLQARLGAGTVIPAEADDFVLPLHVLVPRESVVFLPGEGGEAAEFTVWVVAHDEKNRRVEEKRHRLRVELDPAEDASVVDLGIPIQLPAGRFVVGVAVRDELSQETSFVSTRFAISEPEEAGQG